MSCSISPPTELAIGSGWWRVRAWNGVELSVWNTSLDFTVTAHSECIDALMGSTINVPVEGTLYNLYIAWNEPAPTA